MTATTDFLTDLTTDPDRLVAFIMGVDPKPGPEPQPDTYFVAALSESDPKPVPEPQPDTYFVAAITA